MTAKDRIVAYCQQQVAPDECDHEDAYDEYLREFRESFTDETEIPSESSRHFESKSVAREIDGHWIGWTYWYGGGKHGNPEAVEWLDDAYYLHSHIVMRPVRVFEKI